MSATDLERLRERLRKIESLFAGAGTDGERLAADSARARVRSRLAALKVSEPAAEIQVSLSDAWSRRLFVALCRRYGLEPYRLPRQRLTTVMLRAPKAFVDQVLWPEFEELDAALVQYLNAVTVRLIREEVHVDASEAPVLTQPSAAGAA